MQADHTAINRDTVAELQFIAPDATGGTTQRFDLREPRIPTPAPPPEIVNVADAGQSENIGLHHSGFELRHAPSAIDDFYAHEEVMRKYYAECKALAAELTNAHTTFTFDHIIRETDAQLSAGGIDGAQYRSGPEAGGGYINGVHMDYTDNTTWERYLALHGRTVPSAQHVYALNFWRPLSTSVDDHPLAVCDARTVRAQDLQEVNVYGYGAHNYSWHNIGIETFSVAASPRHRWYYYPGMTPNDVLIIKSFDSAGVVGRACPHASFRHPNPVGIARRSIELRVLCFC
ncbi:MAG: CmcJ/NvfI family oxidoreductase [Pseudomonadota bacterium]